MSYPVTVGQVVQVRSPLHGTTYPVIVTECGRASFLGTNAKGKLVKVRSYSLVNGLESYTPPPQQPGERVLKVTEPLAPESPGEPVTEESSFLDKWTKVINSDRVTEPPVTIATDTIVHSATEKLDRPVKPRRRATKAFGKRQIAFTRDDKDYVIKWDGESSYQLLDDTGTEVFRANSGLELFNCVEEL